MNPRRPALFGVAIVALFAAAIVALSAWPGAARLPYQPAPTPTILAGPGRLAARLIGSWDATFESEYLPRALTISQDRDGRYRITSSDSTAFSPTLEPDGTLYFRPDSFFSTPWHRYRLDEGTGMLQLITADDTAHPRLYRRR